ELPAVRAGDLLTDGARIASFGNGRIRGLRLDLRYPWRAPLAEALAPLVDDPPRVGGDQPGLVPLQSGAIALVHAERGAGGTRALCDVRAAHARGRALWIAPHPTAEPLGALRRAFARRAADEAPPELSGEHEALLESLRAGEGLDTESSAALISAWLGPTGLVLIDDAAQVDADTLEAVADACKRLAIRAILRLS